MLLFLSSFRTCAQCFTFDEKFIFSFLCKIFLFHTQMAIAISSEQVNGFVNPRDILDTWNMCPFMFDFDKVN